MASRSSSSAEENTDARRLMQTTVKRITQTSIERPLNHTSTYRARPNPARTPDTAPAMPAYRIRTTHNIPGPAGKQRAAAGETAGHNARGAGRRLGWGSREEE